MHKASSNRIIEAYENEICIEQWSIDIGLVDKNLVRKHQLPRYKLLKVFVSHTNRIRALRLCFLLVSNLLPLIFFFKALQCSFYILSSKKNTKILKEQNFYITDTLLSLKNFKVVNDKFSFDNNNVVLYKDLKNVCSFLELKEIGSLLKLVYETNDLLKKRSENLERLSYFELKLHCVDLVEIAAFLLVIQKLSKNDPNIYFDQHIQRWAYLISHTVEYKRSNLVQHGYLDASVQFKHAFGEIGTAWILSERFRELFLRIYKVGRFVIVKSALTLQNHLESDGLTPKVFLASSPVSIELEQQFVQECLDNNICVLFKKHPKYKYPGNAFHDFDDNRLFLLDNKSFPLCDVMVTFNSFLGFEYESLGIRVFFLEGSSIEERSNMVRKISSFEVQKDHLHND
ncbi:hypothetical protein DBZ36_11230 [Alginatibacterium sediminis]|uniref:Uncharacterized protein n=1 Tax=Alginatibacterium sediminis TaxID=2164068 RepID=A0A420EAW9_9ALTE|nr:hypothetical protein [Alginatibacterium sediminis]RKF17825.1 hypothetical protein DBZ36_11230 [Alginatibacterium sediminis]